VKEDEMGRASREDEGEEECIFDFGAKASGKETTRKIYT
jgi:hypothetical protein